MARYIESEIEITKRAIENYKSEPEKIKRYQNRLKRLEELKEKIILEQQFELSVLNK